MGTGTENQWIGCNVRRIRKLQRLTQQQLAEKAGVSVHYISAIERGNQSPSLTTLGRISRALSVNLSVLIDNPAEQSKLDQLIEELVNVMKANAREEDVAFLLDIVNAGLERYRVKKTKQK